MIQLPADALRCRLFSQAQKQILRLDMAALTSAEKNKTRLQNNILIEPYKLIWKRQSKIHDCLNVRLKLYVTLMLRFFLEGSSWMCVCGLLKHHALHSQQNIFISLANDVCTQGFIFFCLMKCSKAETNVTVAFLYLSHAFREQISKNRLSFTCVQKAKQRKLLNLTVNNNLNPKKAEQPKEAQSDFETCSTWVRRRKPSSSRRMTSNQSI
jgi:hypothetical protein